MTTSTTTRPARTGLPTHSLNKVPEVTAVFWVIKVLCTTVGETFADLINDKLGLGLTKTTYIMGMFLAVMLISQFTLRRYVPAVYWTVVVLLSVVGTLITDNLVENFGISLTTTTVVFSAVLAVIFAVWYSSERTLSMHSIVTPRREVFYWLAVLFTFALGTAAGDLISEQFALGYFWTTVLFATLIAAVALAHWKLGLNAVLAFWTAYILTRPLGASIGDLLGAHQVDGGLGFGKLKISVVFLLSIAALVGYLTRTRIDVTQVEVSERELEAVHVHYGDADVVPVAPAQNAEDGQNP